MAENAAAYARYDSNSLAPGHVIVVRRRLAEIDAGTARLIDREEFSRRLRARMNRR